MFWRTTKSKGNKFALFSSCTENVVKEREVETSQTAKWVFASQILKDNGFDHATLSKSKGLTILCRIIEDSEKSLGYTVDANDCLVVYVIKKALLDRSARPLCSKN